MQENGDIVVKGRASIPKTLREGVWWGHANRFAAVAISVDTSQLRVLYKHTLPPASAFAPSASHAKAQTRASSLARPGRARPVLAQPGPAHDVPGVTTATQASAGPR